jgi:ketosteroid isomerase-like protein
MLPVSQQNLDLVARGYAVWNSRDLEEALEMVSSDFEFWPMVGFPGVEEMYRGKDGWKRFAEMFWDAWETVEISVDRLGDLGDQVLALVTFEGVGRSSGVNVKLPAGHLWSMRDGLVVRLDAFEPAQALKAAGLAE